MQIEEYPDIARETFQAGHCIGLHSYSHDSLLLAGEQKISAEIELSMAIAEATLGVKPRLFRPPYGRFNRTVYRICNKLNLRIVLWSVNPADYNNPPAEKIVMRIEKKVKPGDIILLHDNGNGADNTLKALPYIIDRLTDKGLSFGKIRE